MQELKDLARQYAAKKPDWAMPGMACRDPVTGDRYRRNDYGWCDADGIFADPDKEEGPSRAIANGPDLDDAATLGAIALGLGSRLRIDHDSDNEWFVRWAPGKDDTLRTDRYYSTRAEAIIRAALAALGE